MNIKNNLLANKKILLISGRLSSNTKHIKNQIIPYISDVVIEHYYRINENWNLSLDKLDLSDYSIIIYDNYP